MGYKLDGDIDFIWERKLTAFRYVSKSGTDVRESESARSWELGVGSRGWSGCNGERPAGGR